MRLSENLSCCLLFQGYQARYKFGARDVMASKTKLVLKRNEPSETRMSRDVGTHGNKYKGYAKVA